MRQDVTHVSTQLVPFPWFKRQSHLYVNFTLPNVDFEGVSTSVSSFGNGELLRRIIVANAGESFPGGVYVDLHAINDAHLGPGGVYAPSRGAFGLVPWGVVWKVVPNHNLSGVLHEMFPRISSF